MNGGKSKTKKQALYLFFTGLCLLFTACNSTRKLSFPGNITILVLDQDDHAVEDYQITLSVIKKKKEKEIKAFSSKSGICFFNNLESGEIYISGKKSGYTLIPLQPLLYDESSKLLCYKIINYDYALDEVERFYENGQIERALELLESLCCENNPLLQNVISFYKAYAYADLKEKEKAELELLRITELKDSAFAASKYRRAIEKKLIAMD